MPGINKFLSYRYTGMIFLLLALISRIATQLFFFRTGVDRSLQLVGVKNFLSGQGLTFNHVTMENLSQEIYIPIEGWPPGYPLFISFLNIFTGDITIAAIVFDLISIILLVFISRKLLQFLGGTTLMLNMYTLVLGFFLYDFCQVSSPDMNAVAFLLLTVYLSLIFIKKERSGIGLPLLIALTNFIPPFLRYMFIPVSLILPMYLLAAGIFSGSKKTIKGGLVVSIITVLLLAGLLFFQKSYTGSATYVNEVGKGFFPNNLLQFYPVAIAAFANLPFIYNLLDGIGISYGSLGTPVFILNSVLLITLMILCFRLFIQKKFRSASIRDHFVYLCTLISLVVIILLILLSLYYAPFVRPGYSWTFVFESRYFAFIILLLQLAAFIFIFNNWNSIRNSLVRFSGILIAVLLTIEVLHGIYFSSKLLLMDKTYFHSDKNYIIQKDFIRSYVKNFKTEKNADLIFTSEDKTFLNIASLAGAKVLYNFDQAKTLNATKPFTLIVIIKNNDPGIFDSLLTNSKILNFRTIASLSFYEYRSDTFK